MMTKRSTPAARAMNRPCLAKSFSVAALAISMLAAPSLVAQPTSEPDPARYVDQLNDPILRVTAKSKSYEAYFQAWMKIDVTAPGAPVTVGSLRYGTPPLEQAKAWVGSPMQQEAIRILLAEDGLNKNVTFRPIFGLPYGMRDLPIEMDSFGFAVYLADSHLDEVDFAYLPAYRQLWLLLIAEAHRRVEDGDTGGAVTSLVASMRMARQLCDRAYSREMDTGMELVIESMMQMREFMWHYRDTLAVDDCKKIAEELEFLDIDKIKAPRAPELIGEQIVERVFGRDLRPNPDVFSEVLARFESRNNPLGRFAAAAKWRDLMSQHATYNETLAELRNVAGDIKLRWRFAYNDPSFSREPYIDTLDPIKYAIPRAVFRGMENLRPVRFDMEVRQHGIACAAGVAAYQKREGGKLELGVKSENAPISIVQIQPSFVNSESMLLDPHNTTYDPQNPLAQKMHYAVITNPERIRTTLLMEFIVRTPNGNARLVEGWPLLYSVGWDGDDDYGEIHTAERPSGMGTPDGDFVFWPPVEVIARDQ